MCVCWCLTFQTSADGQSVKVGRRIQELCIATWVKFCKGFATLGFSGAKYRASVTCGLTLNACARKIDHRERFTGCTVTVLHKDCVFCFVHALLLAWFDLEYFTTWI